MTTYYKAEFSDGTVIKRATRDRKYSHAWIIKRATKDPALFGPHFSVTGFCSTLQLAQRSISSYGGGDNVLLREIAPTVEVTRKEYRS